MKGVQCEVGPCSRAAKVLVLFVHSKVPHPYCYFHSYDYRGRMRWRAIHIRSVQKID